MHFTSETTADGVTEHCFTLDGVPGVLWLPATAQAGSPAAAPADAAPTRRPLVLLGHGGGSHKLAPGLVARAGRCATRYGFAVAALDAPGHGERPRTAQDERFATEIGELLATGRPISARVARHTAALAEQAVPEWQAVIDALRKLDGVGPDGPVGYWGLSLGSVIGVPLAGADPRITVAVFGLAGDDSLTEAARRVTVPVEFLLQWDDELVPRRAALALFDAFASAEKTLHANPGGHLDVPDFEVTDSELFLARHLR
ncbi:alpha/beta hydrolase [Kitasatospora sp. CM 4170]|uniref:Alpha/beta hydrolase n=1 Tax=Kitasatospora aburaviensis TaxID=67265 RepID=A0ABW1F8W4_9ACTN|nr:alpha/beta hydrolase [Kitasatospora sp. CM 4170]WNM49824.1 alpha/beta hydrolase [Kitasatospora sp. CM 4170]